MQAIAFCKQPDAHETGPVVVIYGPVRFLRTSVLRELSRLVLGSDAEDDEDVSITRFSGKEIDLASVHDELRTISMWGDRRLVVVDDADDFVKTYRSGLEKLLENPAKKSVLVLLVKSWPKNTRLAKRIAKIGLDIDCAELKGGALTRWLGETARDEYGKQLGPAAAAELVNLAGNDLGLLDQELAKLAAYVGDNPKIEADDVRTLVGGWKAETAWTMIGAIQSGDLGTSLECLDKLLAANEAPQRILGGINYLFRRLAQATEMTRQGRPLPAALKEAGLYHPQEIDTASGFLRRIGRPRAERIHARLLVADADLKGNSRLSPQLQLERLLLELSGRSSVVVRLSLNDGWY
jgi:DNA polymerase-3 subunit delta